MKKEPLILKKSKFMYKLLFMLFFFCNFASGMVYLLKEIVYVHENYV